MKFYKSLFNTSFNNFNGLKDGKEFIQKIIKQRFKKKLDKQKLSLTKFQEILNHSTIHKDILGGFPK